MTVTLVLIPQHVGTADVPQRQPDFFPPPPIPPQVLHSNSKEDNIRGGKQNQRDSDIKQYPKDFQSWYHRDYKPKVHPGRNATPDELKEAYENWLGLGKPKRK